MIIIVDSAIIGLFYLSLDEEGVRQQGLVNWYLKEVEGEIDSVQELTDKKLLVEKVIDRLVNHVSIEKDTKKIDSNFNL